jgi:hypothetical protein
MEITVYAELRHLCRSGFGLRAPDSARSFGLGEPLAMEAGSARPQCPTASLAAPCRRKRKPGQQTLSTRITDAATSD